MDFSEALTHINTTAQRDLLVDELHTLLNSLYGIKKGADKKITEHISYPFKDTVLTMIRKNKLKEDDIFAVQELIKSFIESLKQVPTIKITLAYGPKDKDFQDIHSWILSNVKKKVLLDVEISPTLLGGAIIEAGGYYKDLSLRKKLNGKANNGPM